MPKKWIAEDKVIVGSRPEIPDSVVKSAARVVQIMEVFDEIRREANVIELCSRLGYPQSSTSALLRTLVNMGFLQYDPYARTYIPSTRAAMLASWVNDRSFGEGRLERLMNEINERSGELVILATRNRLNVQYIQVLQSRVRKRLQQTVGAQRPMVACGMGRALLSCFSDAEVRKIVHVSNAYAAEGEDEVNATELLDQIQAVRRAGYCFQPDLVRNGGSAIAMPIPVDDPAAQPLSIGIGGPTRVLVEREAEFVAILRDAFARHLGCGDTDMRALAS